MRFWPLYITSLLCFPVLSGMGQTPAIERLKNNIQLASGPGEQLNTMLLLCEQGYSLHPDTLMYYARQAKMLAIKNKNTAREAEAMYYQSYALTTKGLIDSSLQLAAQCLELVGERMENHTLRLKLLNQMGRCYMRKNQYSEAIAMGYQVINGAEKSRDTILQMMGKTLVGWAHLEMGQHRQALAWHHQALHTTNNVLLHEKYSILFANLAINYSNLGATDSAFYYISNAVRFARKHQNLFALSNSLAIQAQLFVRSGRQALAEQPLQEAVAIRKLIGDPFYIVSDMSQLGLYYASNGQADKGIAICKEGIAIAARFKIDAKLLFLYNTLAENYKVAGHTQHYSETLEKIISLKDSVYAGNSASALAEMQTRYELQQKENTNMQLELNLTKKNYLLYGSLALTLMAGLSAILLFRNYRRKQQLKMELALAREKSQSESAVTDAKEKERKRIAADLHDNLGAYAASIAANLDYITIVENNQESMVAMHELRNNSHAIVSQLNDTIWALKKETLSLTAISDRVKIFVQRIQPSYPEVVIDIREEIKHDFRLAPIQAFHLFRIVQEAISNALRHSGGNTILVDIIGNDHWQVRISDNGKWLKRDKVIPAKTGHGLSNMESRADEAGWQISWNINAFQGTDVIIVPTTNCVLENTHAG